MDEEGFEEFVEEQILVFRGQVDVGGGVIYESDEGGVVVRREPRRAEEEEIVETLAEGDVGTGEECGNPGVEDGLGGGGGDYFRPPVGQRGGSWRFRGVGQGNVLPPAATRGGKAKAAEQEERENRRQECRRP